MHHDTTPRLRQGGIAGVLRETWPPAEGVDDPERDVADGADVVEGKITDGVTVTFGHLPFGFGQVVLSSSRHRYGEPASISSKGSVSRTTVSGIASAARRSSTSCWLSILRASANRRTPVS